MWVRKEQSAGDLTRLEQIGRGDAVEARGVGSGGLDLQGAGDLRQVFGELGELTLQLERVGGV